MRSTLTKLFKFSASFEERGKIHGHNYKLSVTIDSVSDEAEAKLGHLCQTLLIEKLESRDLGLHVDFLKNLEINDSLLLDVFWEKLEGPLKPVNLLRLAIERDDRTKLEKTLI